MQSFLHGTEIIEVETGSAPVTEVRTAVVGLVGVAPTEYGKNTCILVKNQADAAQFGYPKAGFDIPQALAILQGEGAGLIVVVNVFDAALHTALVAAEAQTVTDGKLKLAFPHIGVPVLKKADGTASAYVLGTDYNLDEGGNFTVIAGRIPEATVIKFDYTKFVPGNVTSNHIIGTVGVDGLPTGIKTWDLALNQFGFRPKILIAPGRSAVKAISTELLLATERLRAITILDSTYGSDVAAAIASRGDITKSFGTSNKRSIGAYPYIKGYDKTKDLGIDGTDTNTDFPYSAFLAGVICQTDREFGYWWSPSNKVLKTATGVERPISANINDANTDTNLLNAAGIVTVFNGFGTGLRTWGNRNLSYPTNTAVDNFIPLLRTFDVMHESLELAALKYQDRPGTQAFIDDVRQNGNDFAAVLIGRGALTPGSKVSFLKEDNPPAQLAAGQYVFDIVKMGPTPAERITYKSRVDTSLLFNSLK